jgi:hypothetical protein
MQTNYGKWFFDPISQEWQKRTGPNTWLVIKGDFTNPPGVA